MRAMVYKRSNTKMSFLAQNRELVIPVSFELVFDAILKVVPRIKGMKIANWDKQDGYINAKAGMSMFSWGEKIPIRIIDLGGDETKIIIKSSVVWGGYKGNIVHADRNRTNIEKILTELYSFLGIKQEF